MNNLCMERCLKEVPFIFFAKHDISTKGPYTGGITKVRGCIALFRSLNGKNKLLYSIHGSNPFKAMSEKGNPAHFSDMHEKIFIVCQFAYPIIELSQITAIRRRYEVGESIR